MRKGTLAILLGFALVFISTAHADGPTTRRAPFDWRLAGVLVYSLEIPGSGGAWAMTIARERPETPGALDYLLVICDHAQAVTAACAKVQLGDAIEVAGYAFSQEPYTGQRLSVRTLRILPSAE